MTAPANSMTAASGALFDDQTVAALERSWGKEARSGRPRLWWVAARRDEAELRAWLEAEYDLASERERVRLRTRLLDEKQFSQTVTELAAVAILRNSGYVVTPEPDLDGLTPDILIAADDYGREVIVEVWTRSVPREAIKLNRRWARLGKVIETIPSPVQLRLEKRPGVESLVVPDEPTLGYIKRCLSAELSSRPPVVGHTIWVGDYGFMILGLLAEGHHAVVLPVVQSAHCDSQLVIEAVERKTGRYQSLAQTRQSGLVVIVAGEPSSGVSEQLVGAILSGTSSTGFTIPLGNPGPIARQPVRFSSDRPPSFADALSAVGWLQAGPPWPGRLVIWPLSSAAIPASLSPSSMSTKS